MAEKPDDTFSDDKVSEAAYRKALAEGQADVAYSRVMFLGTAGVGKTSFKRSLMKLPWEPNTTSTVVSDISSIRPFKHERCTHTGGQWKTVTHKDEIEELAQLISAVHFKSDSKASKFELKPRLHSFLVKFCSLFKKSSNEDNEVTCRINEIISEAVSLIKAGELPYRSSSLSPQPYLNFWDCGGQPPFLEILPAFLSSRTLFLLIFDAEKDLNTNWQSVVHIEGRRIDQEEVKVTTLDYMLNWMSNIHSHLMTYDEDGGVCEYPRMYCIGTHGDRLTEEKKSEVESELEEHLEGKAYSNLVEDIAIVDNTSSGKGAGAEDPSIMVLRKAVVDFTKNKLILKTPVNWVLFREVLQVLSKEYNVISLDMAHIIGVASKISKEDVPHVLTFFHDVGVLLYYPQLDGLKDKVIINPKYFVDALGKVLPFSDIDSSRYSDEWKLFHEFGILVQPLYVEVWKEFKDLKPEFFIEVLVHFRLAVEVETAKRDPCFKQYFMPLVLASASNDDITSMTLSTASFQAAPLHITFSSGYVPPGFFTRFVAVVANSRKTELYLNKGVYRNCVTFRYQDPISHSIEHIVVTDRNNAIQVFVDCLVPGSINFTKICQDMYVLIKGATQEVLDILEKCRVRAINEKSTKYKIKHKFQYVCTKCPPSSSPHYIITAPTDQTQESHVCCNISNTLYRPLTDQEKVWFKDSMKATYKASSSTKCSDSDTSHEKDPSHGQQSSINDPDVNVFQSHFDDLCDVVSLDVLQVSNKCTSLKLIGFNSEARRMVLTDGVDSYKKASKLLSEIGSNLESHSNKREYLLSVIEAFLNVGSPLLSHIAGKMQQDFLL